MPLPETLLSAPLTDLDLVVTEGVMPDGLHGEMVISAPVVDDRLGYQLFGFGALVRIAFTPGTYGAPAGVYPLRHHVIDTPVYRLHQKAQERFVGGLLGFETPWGAPNMANTAPLPFGDRLFATWDAPGSAGSRSGLRRDINRVAVGVSCPLLRATMQPIRRDLPGRPPR